MLNSSSTSPVQVLIVDDERLARLRLRELLEGRDGVTIVAEAENHDAAVAAIHKHEPDLVFLDVQMPGQTGVEVIRTVGPEAMPVTVFVTAYDVYAVEAFDLSAIDYLLKPFDDERFEQALRRAQRHVKAEKVDGLTERLMQLLQQTSDEKRPREQPEDTSYLERIAVQKKGRVRIVPVDDIRFISAEGAYAKLHTDNSTHLIREKLEALEKRLDPSNFYRIHRSTIVRLNEVEVIHRRGGGSYAIRLRDGTKLNVSRSRIDTLEQRLEGGRGNG